MTPNTSSARPTGTVAYQDCIEGLFLPVENLVQSIEAPIYLGRKNPAKFSRFIPYIHREIPNISCKFFKFHGKEKGIEDEEDHGLTTPTYTGESRPKHIKLAGN